MFQQQKMQRANGRSKRKIHIPINVILHTDYTRRKEQQLAFVIQYEIENFLSLS
jgi:hypothetical protein